MNKKCNRIWYLINLRIYLVWIINIETIFILKKTTVFCFSWKVVKIDLRKNSALMMSSVVMSQQINNDSYFECNRGELWPLMHEHFNQFREFCTAPSPNTYISQCQTKRHVSVTYSLNVKEKKHVLVTLFSQCRSTGCSHSSPRTPQCRHHLCC